MSGIYQKVMKHLRSVNEEYDNYLDKLMKFSYQVSQTELGIRSEFQFEYEEASRLLSTLNAYTTAAEKMMLLYDANMAIIKEISLRSTNKKNQELITTDDLLPIIVFIICNSNVPDFKSNINFMEQFTPQSISTTHLGYTLASFHAATEYMWKDQKFKEIVDNHAPKSELIRRNSNSMPISLPQRSNSITSGSTISTPKKTPSTTQIQQPASITSSKAVPRYQAPPTIINLNDTNEALGDFLSSLMSNDSVLSSAQFRN